ncbi:hypothetical protein B0I35DRAFT_405038 [Stachybotrys elegans]|uniref:Uncharacterized protein n=1 Tax=Stachybotrys elegans TaxID=80388 RepID=A0A8K0T415_9HYPO|nr:hypothetical protein B0I35DRAFT_405038 [Stachybotrys elegans]
MLSLLSWFTRRKESKLGDYDVYPLSFMEQAGLVYLAVMNFSFYYEDVLDADKLHESLARLVQKDDWRKCGGRVRRNAQKHIEIHVPKNFTPSCPSLTFLHTDFAGSIDKHPVASRLRQRQTDSPCIYENVEDFIPLSLGQDSMRAPLLEDYTNSDKPLITLSVTSFEDATIVSVTFPHCLVDGMGFAELREHLVKPVADSNKHVLESMVATEAAKKKYVLEDKQLRGLSLVILLARLAWDALVGVPAEAYELHLTSAFIKYLRQKAESEISNDKVDGKAQFISDGDIITAWGSQMAFLSATSNGSTTIYNVFDLRTRLPAEFVEPDTQYLENMVLPAATLLAREETKEASLGKIALRIRQSIIEQTPPTQIPSLLRLTKRWLLGFGTWPAFASWDSNLILWTNWTKAKFLETADFGPAVGDGKGECRPSTFWGFPFLPGPKPGNTWIIYGRDARGNYRLQSALREPTVQRIKQDFAEFEKYSNSQLGVGAK